MSSCCQGHSCQVRVNTPKRVERIQRSLALEEPSTSRGTPADPSTHPLRSCQKSVRFRLHAVIVQKGLRFRSSLCPCKYDQRFSVLTLQSDFHSGSRYTSRIAVPATRFCNLLTEYCYQYPDRSCLQDKLYPALSLSATLHEHVACAISGLGKRFRNVMPTHVHNRISHHSFTRPIELYKTLSSLQFAGQFAFSLPRLHQ